MKKVICVVMVMTMIFTCLSYACAEKKIMDNIYWFKNMELEPYKTFKELVDGWSAVIDARYYLVDSNGYLGEDYSKLTLKDLEKVLNDKLNQLGACAEAHVYRVGDGILHVEINSITDLVSLDTDEVFGTSETAWLKETNTRVFGIDWLIWASYEDMINE